MDSEPSDTVTSDDKCMICDCEFSDTKRDHFENFHFQDGQSIPCILCKEKDRRIGRFKTAYSYIKHIKDKHSTPSVHYKCNWKDCKLKSSSRDKRDVYKHISRMHAKKAKCLSCEEVVLAQRFASHSCTPRVKKSSELISTDSDDDFVEDMKTPKSGQEKTMARDNSIPNNSAPVKVVTQQTLDSLSTGIIHHASPNPAKRSHPRRGFHGTEDTGTKKCKTIAAEASVNELKTTIQDGTKSSTDKRNTGEHNVNCESVQEVQISVPVLAAPSDGGFIGAVAQPPRDHVVLAEAP